MKCTNYFDGEFCGCQLEQLSKKKEYEGETKTTTSFNIWFDQKCSLTVRITWAAARGGRVDFLLLEEYETWCDQTESSTGESESLLECSLFLCANLLVILFLVIFTRQSQLICFVTVDDLFQYTKSIK